MLDNQAYDEELIDIEVGSPEETHRSEDKDEKRKRSTLENENRERISPSMSSSMKEDEKEGQESHSGVRTLFIRNLAMSVKELELEEFFSKFGKVTDVQIVRDPHTNESRGFGFLTMNSVDEADIALANVEGSELKGRRLVAEKAKRTRARTPTPGEYRGIKKEPLRRSRVPRSSRSRSRSSDRDRDRDRTRDYRSDYYYYARMDPRIRDYPYPGMPLPPPPSFGYPPLMGMSGYRGYQDRYYEKEREHGRDGDRHGRDGDRNERDSMGIARRRDEGRYDPRSRSPHPPGIYSRSAPTFYPPPIPGSSHGVYPMDRENGRRSSRSRSRSRSRSPFRGSRNNLVSQYPLPPSPHASSRDRYRPY